MTTKPEPHRLTFWTLVRRSLRFHAQSHLGVVLGSAIGSAALVGALLVGDSVRETLKQRALSRLGHVYYALQTRERCFETHLSERLVPDETPVSAPIADSARPLSTMLELSGVVSKADGSARDNGVQVLGIGPESLTRLAWRGEVPASTWLAEGEGSRAQSPGEPLAAWKAGQTALLSPQLARQLGVRAGDDIVVRVRQQSALGLDAALSPREHSSVALRLKVEALLPPQTLGEFSLSAQPLGAANVVLPLSLLQDRAGVSGRANLLLFGQVWQKRKFTSSDVLRSKMADWLRWGRPFGSARIVRDGNGYRVVYSGISQGLMRMLTPEARRAVEANQALAWLEARLNQCWRLEDAGLSVRAVEQPRTATGGEYMRPFVEVSEGRLFLEKPVVEAALRPRTTLLTNREAFSQDTPKEAEFCQFVTHGVRVLTYLANLIQAGERSTPYSMVTATDGPQVPRDMAEDEILVNQWLAEDLKVHPGDSVSLSYYVADSGTRLVERTNSFRVRAVVPLKGPYADRTLMPEFPGLAKAESTHDWDAGFPLVYPIREQDEAYWKQYRGTPKAFISLAAGQKLWANRFGSLTAIRYEVPTNSFASTYREAAYRNLLANLTPGELGLRLEPVRAQALRAAEQGQDFGQLFLGFSFFLVIAALLLMALLFQFGLEQRAVEVTTLLALGFTRKRVRRLFLAEGAVLALAGGVVGTLGGVAYAKAMLWGLGTVWRSAVGNEALAFHATPATLVIGLCASTAVAVVTICMTLRSLSSGQARGWWAGRCQWPRNHLTWRRSALINTPLQRGERRTPGSPNRFNGLAQGGETVETVPKVQQPPVTPLKRGANESSQLASAICGLAAGVGAFALVAWATARGGTGNAGAFFGAGALLLVSGLAGAAVWLGRLARAGSAGLRSLGALGLRGCARRRNRSLATIALLACGCFIVVAVGVFRLEANQHPERRSSGAGGFALLGQSTLPVVQDLNSQSGREFLGLGQEELKGVAFVSFRVRAGDDASCLNLNRAQQPRLLGVRPESLAGRFSFASVTEGQRAPGWGLLQRNAKHQTPNTREAPSTKHRAPSAVAQTSGSALQEPPIPAIADANTIEWGLGKKVGDTVDYTDEQGRAFKVRLVGAVANSILQGSLIINEAEFVKRFPNESGYRMWLVDAPPNSVPQVSATLSRALQDAGLELTPAAQRLSALNAVENTYLGTFQVLGGLGLLLGSAGLGVVVLRNVLERRGELGLLAALGFRRRALRRLVLAEHGALLALGLGLGIVAALVAVWPAVWSSGAAVPYMSLGLTLAGVWLNGLLWTWLATRYSLRGNLVSALRNE